MFPLHALSGVRGARLSRRVYASLSAGAQIIQKARVSEEIRNKELLMSQACDIRDVASCSPLIS